MSRNTLMNDLFILIITFLFSILAIIFILLPLLGINNTSFLNGLLNLLYLIFPIFVIITIIYFLYEKIPSFRDKIRQFPNIFTKKRQNRINESDVKPFGQPPVLPPIPQTIRPIIIPKSDSNSELFNQVLQEIELFKTPRPYYDNEITYQDTLFAVLQIKFSDIKHEHQIEDTRPDITIQEIAIEVKGPTKKYDLDSIFQKCASYNNHWKKFIVVLFNVQVSDYIYDWWLDRITKQGKLNFERFEVIRK